MKKVISFVKKIVFSVAVLYCTNMLIYSSNVIIPINLVSVLSLAVLGLPGLLSLLIIYFII